MVINFSLLTTAFDLPPPQKKDGYKLMGDQLLLLSLGTEQELCCRGVWEE